MKLLSKLFGAVVSHLVGYRVVVLWNHAPGQYVYKVHQAVSVADGLEWMQAYPNNAVVRVRRNLTGMLMAERVS